MARPLALLALLVALVLPLGCGSGDDEDSGGPEAIASCLEDAGLDTREQDVNTLDEELVAKGATLRLMAIDVDQQEYSYEVTIFSSPEKAAEYAKTQQADFDEMPQLKFVVEASGANAVSTTSDAPKRKEVLDCAKDNG